MLCHRQPSVNSSRRCCGRRAYARLVLLATILPVLVAALWVLTTDHSRRKPETLSWSLGGKQLRNLDLRGWNLRGANLAEATLVNVDLRGADLREANLSDARLERCDLRSARLTGADLEGARLEGCDLRWAEGFRH